MYLIIEWHNNGQWPLRPPLAPSHHGGHDIKHHELLCPQYPEGYTMDEQIAELTAASRSASALVQSGKQQSSQQSTLLSHLLRGCVWLLILPNGCLLAWLRATAQRTRLIAYHILLFLVPSLNICAAGATTLQGRGLHRSTIKPSPLERSHATLATLTVETHPLHYLTYQLPMPLLVIVASRWGGVRLGRCTSPSLYFISCTIILHN